MPLHAQFSPQSTGQSRPSARRERRHRARRAGERSERRWTHGETCAWRHEFFDADDNQISTPFMIFFAVFFSRFHINLSSSLRS